MSKKNYIRQFLRAGLFAGLLFFFSCKPQSKPTITSAALYSPIQFELLLQQTDSLRKNPAFAASDPLTQGVLAYQNAMDTVQKKSYRKKVDNLYQAIKAFKLSGYPAGIGFSYSALADKYMGLLHSDSVLICYNLAIEQFSQIPDTFMILRMLNNMGNYMSELGNFPMALNYYQKAQGMHTKPDLMNAITLFNLATHYSSTGKHSESKAIFAELLKYPYPLDSTFISDIYNNLGAIELSLNQPDEALRYIKLSEKFQSDADFYTSQFRCINKASAYLKIRNFEKGNQYIDSLRKNFDRLTPENKRYYYLLQIYANPALDEKLLDQYLQIADSTQQAAFSSKLLEVKRSFEIKEQQALIELLESNNYFQKKQLALLYQTLVGVCVLLIATAIFAVLLMRQRKKLNESQKALHQAMQVKNRVFSIIGHDLRGPIGSLKELFELYLQQNNWSREDMQRLLAVARDSSTSAYYLLENLLVWANSLNGKISYHPKIVNAYDFIIQITNPLEGWAKQKGIRTNIQANRTMIEMDTNMIGTVLRNLLSNAIKYSPPNSEILIQATEKAHEWIFSITDEGPGMNPEQIHHLFGNLPSNEANNSIHHGLGLLLCKEFTLRHNGRIEAENMPQKGLKVIVTLPRTNKA